MIDPVAFYIFDFPVRWYGLAYFVTFLLSLKLGIYLSKYRNEFTKKDLEHFVNYAILGVILGGRIGEFVFYEKKISKEIFFIWNGGMSFHGGVVGMIFAVILYCTIKKKPVLPLADIVCTCVPIGCFLGRIANFINQEILGKSTILFSSGRHPVVLYEAFLEGFLLFILLFEHAKKTRLRKPGETSALFFIFYGIFRIIAEHFRVPDGMIGLFSKGQALSIAMVLFGMLLYKYTNFIKEK